MRFLECIKSWFRSPRFEVSGRHLDPCTSGGQAFALRSSSSISRYEPPPLPLNGSGEAARQSAATRNSKLFQSAANDLLEPSSEYPPSYWKTDARTNILGQSLTQDVESGVNLEVPRHYVDLKETTTPIIRKDPFRCLPPELTATILSYLDTTSLARAEMISRAWYRDARQSYAWRHVFRNETQKERQNSMAGSNQYSISGAGLGTSSPNQEFKLMLQARRELQKRWRNGRAAAIYLEGHTDSVYCVQFDEAKIITGSRDRTIRIWDSRSHKCVKMLGTPNRSSATNRLQLQTHGTGQLGRPARISIPTQDNIRPSAATADLHHNGSVLCLQYDDHILVSGSSDSTCIVWDIRDDFRPLRRLRSHTAGVLDVCFDKQHIVSCSKDTTICLWSRLTGERLRRMTGHRGPVNAVQLRGNLIVSASGDGVAKLWNLASGHCIKEFPSKDRGMACVDFSLDSRMILAGGNDQVVYQFDTGTGQMVQQMVGHQGLVRSLHLDNVNARVISGSYDTSIRAYDFTTGEQIAAFVQWTTSWILSAKSDYRRIVAASQDGRTLIIDFGFDVPDIDLLAA